MADRGERTRFTAAEVAAEAEGLHEGARLLRASVEKINKSLIESARHDAEPLARMFDRRADMLDAFARSLEAGGVARDRAERLLSALDWAGDMTEWEAGSWVARKDWRTVILDALYPLPDVPPSTD